MVRMEQLTPTTQTTYTVTLRNPHKQNIGSYGARDNSDDPLRKFGSLIAKKRLSRLKVIEKEEGFVDGMIEQSVQGQKTVEKYSIDI